MTGGNSEEDIRREEETRVEDDGPEERSGRAQGWSAPFGELQDMMEELVDGFRGLTPTAYVRYPRLEMAQTDESYVVWLDLPGVREEDLEVSALGDELTVSGQRRRPEYPEGAQIRRSERSYGRFRRVVRFPADVDPDGIKARLKSGVLNVTLPRHVESEGRTIDVETE
jgi:HSP20 family protein